MSEKNGKHTPTNKKPTLTVEQVREMNRARYAANHPDRISAKGKARRERLKEEEGAGYLDALRERFLRLVMIADVVEEECGCHTAGEVYSTAVNAAMEYARATLRAELTTA